jgi:hypothetical protein
MSAYMFIVKKPDKQFESFPEITVEPCNAGDIPTVCYVSGFFHIYIV